MRACGLTVWDVPTGRRPGIDYVGAGCFQPATRRFCLPGLWTLHIYHYTAGLTVDGVEYQIHPGRIALFPPGTAKTYVFVERSEHYCSHFRLAAGGGARSRIPAMVDLQDAFARIDAEMAVIVQIHPTDPLRAEVKLWNVLMELGEAASTLGDGPSTTHAALQRATRLIELRLHERLDIPALAHDVGVSHNYLIRLFRKTYGTTVVEYIRTRRMLKARHLIKATTRPIKEIACEVGLGDLHLFNKTVRRHFGRSPRALRERP
jgi:AraC-like DNA-binding protein